MQTARVTPGTCTTARCRDVIHDLTGANHWTEATQLQNGRAITVWLNYLNLQTRRPGGCKIATPHPFYSRVMAIPIPGSFRPTWSRKATTLAARSRARSFLAAQPSRLTTGGEWRSTRA